MLKNTFTVWENSRRITIIPTDVLSVFPAYFMFVDFPLVLSILLVKIHFYQFFLTSLQQLGFQEKKHREY